MKLSFYFVAVFLLSCFVLYGQIDFNENQLLYKNNKVKSIKSYEFKNKKEEKKGKGRLFSDGLYDTTGRLIAQISYHSKEYHNTYQYNAKGDLSEEISGVLNQQVLSSYGYKYDAKNRIVEKSKNGSAENWYYTYDSAGNKASEKWLLYGETQPRQYFKDTFEYSATSKIIKMTRFWSDGSISFSLHYEYDTAGNLSKKTRAEGGKITDVWTFSYDLNGNCIEDQVYDNLKNKVLSGRTMKYDSKGLIIYIFRTPHDETKNYVKLVYEYYN